jgi:hypothetical protein
VVVQVARLMGHAHDLLSLDVHPSGGLLATAGVDNTVRLWDVGSRRVNQALEAATRHPRRARTPFPTLEMAPCYTTRRVHSDFVDSVHFVGGGEGGGDGARAAGGGGDGDGVVEGEGAVEDGVLERDDAGAALLSRGVLLLSKCADAWQSTPLAEQLVVGTYPRTLVTASAAATASAIARFGAPATPVPAAAAGGHGGGKPARGAPTASAAAAATSAPAPYRQSQRALLWMPAPTLVEPDGYVAFRELRVPAEGTGTYFNKLGVVHRPGGGGGGGGSGGSGGSDDSDGGGVGAPAPTGELHVALGGEGGCGVVVWQVAAGAGVAGGAAEALEPWHDDVPRTLPSVDPTAVLPLPAGLSGGDVSGLTARQVAFAPGGRAMFVAFHDGRVLRWDAAE